MNIFKIKFFLIFFIFIFSFIYFIPNIYRDMPSLILSSNKLIDDKFIFNIVKNLNSHSILLKKKIVEDKNLFLCFYSTEDQFKAYELLIGKKLPININFILLHNDYYFFKLIGAKAMKLGLDLRGGVHLVLNVHFEYIIKNFLKNKIEFLQKFALENNINCNIKKDIDTFYVVLKNDKDFNIFFKFCEEKLKSFDFLKLSNNSFSLKFKEKVKLSLIDSAVDKTFNIINKRISDLGFFDFVIHKSGLNNIVVELPGIQDISYAKKILGQTATLKFMLVDDSINLINSSNVLKKAENSCIFYTKDGYPFLLNKDIIIDSSSIVNASFSLDSKFNKPCVNVKLSNDIHSFFRDFTINNIGRHIAIVYKDYLIDEDGNRYSNEVIINIAKIMGVLVDSFQISGLSLNEAKDLSLLLRSGSLPTSVSIVEEKIIGPSLGEENISKGFYIIFTSLFFIFIFMLLKYGFLGIIGIFSLFSNLLLLLSFMSIFSLTLTFSCLAGIALTIGISIDANILIFERINEERKLYLDKSLDYISSGFDNALRAIFDSNLTTLLVSLILYIFIIGPMKSFAIVLSIGLFTSFYSSIFFTKFFLDLFFKNNITYYEY